MTNCLVIIRNKKLNIDYSRLGEFISVFSAACYYFEKISFIAFDDSRFISDQLHECRAEFENAVVLCEDRQYLAIASFLQKIYESAFDDRFYLNCGHSSAMLGRMEEGAEFARSCVSFLNRKYKVSYDKFYIKCVSAPAELIRSGIESASADGTDLAFGVYDNFGDQKIEISYSSTTPKMTADSVNRTLVSTLSDYIYALEDITIEQRLYDLLKLRRMKIAVAESFTGGGIALRLVSVPGISEVYTEGLNTYANESKMLRLGVNELTLKQYGAVSDRTACEMAEGLLSSGLCDVAISTTGIAGPKSDNTSKPVGLAYIAVGTHDGVKVYKFNYRGDRERITKTAINDALFLAYKLLK